MSTRINAPETLPECPVCNKIVPCFTDSDLEKHIRDCIKKRIDRKSRFCIWFPFKRRKYTHA